jgi:hypothetical protein
MEREGKGWLEEQAVIQEHSFHSDVALVGPLIVRLREAWNSVAAKWYVRSLLQQQNRFNLLIARQLREQETRLIAQDREQTDLVHDLAAVSAQLAQANRLLASIDARLARLEEASAHEQGA